MPTDVTWQVQQLELHSLGHVIGMMEIVSILRITVSSFCQQDHESGLVSIAEQFGGDLWIPVMI